MNSVRDKLPEHYTMTMHHYQLKVLENSITPYGIQQWNGYFGSFYDAYTDPVSGEYTPPVLALSHFLWYPEDYGPDFWNDCGVDYIDNYTFDTGYTFENYCNFEGKDAEEVNKMLDDAAYYVEFDKYDLVYAPTVRAIIGGIGDYIA